MEKPRPSHCLIRSVRVERSFRPVGAGCGQGPGQVAVFLATRLSDAAIRRPALRQMQVRFVSDPDRSAVPHDGGTDTFEQRLALGVRQQSMIGMCPQQIEIRLDLIRSAPRIHAHRYRDVQDLMQKVTVRPDDGLTARYPVDLASRVIVRLKGGESFTQEITDFPGAPARPFTWKDIDAKFDKMVARRIGDGLSDEIKDAVRSLENIQISKLMKLLAFAKSEEKAA
jgi:hypothetical protein